MSIWKQIPEAEFDARNLRKNNKSWYDIADELTDKYGVDFTANQIRKRIRRTDTNPAMKSVGVLCDFHVPMELPNVLKIIEDNLRGRVDSIIIDGDLFDVYSLSIFPKRKFILMRDELKRAYEILEVLTSWFSNVILIKGNHDDRFARYIYDKITPEVQFLIDKNILNRLKNGFEYEDEITNEAVYYPPLEGLTVINEWWYKYNDVIFAHPSSFFKTEMQTVVKTYDYFVNKGITCKALFIGHTHHAGIVFKNGVVMLIEGGCLCKDMEYAEGKVTMRPQERAITIMDFNNDSICGVKQLLFDQDGNRLNGVEY